MLIISIVSMTVITLFCAGGAGVLEVLGCWGTGGAGVLEVLKSRGTGDAGDTGDAETCERCEYNLTTPTYVTQLHVIDTCPVWTYVFTLSRAIHFNSHDDHVQ